MSRSTERVLHNFFGLYTTKLGHRKRHIDGFRFLSLPKRQNTVPEEKVPRDPFDFHSSSEKTYGPLKNRKIRRFQKNDLAKFPMGQMA